jgi:ATP-dependent Lon protease
LLEIDTACSFTDEFAEIALDASQVIWIATANDERAIPEPILNRMNVYEVQAPDRDAARAIAIRLYTGIRADHDWGQRFEPLPDDEVLERIGELAPREMRRAWMTAFGNAKLDRRSRIETRDLPDARGKRGAIGFMQ